MIIIVISFAQDVAQVTLLIFRERTTYTGHLAHYPPTDRVLMGYRDSFTAQNLKMDWCSLRMTLQLHLLCRLTQAASF